MAAETILTAFREITDLNTAQYSDDDVSDKAEPWALDKYNTLMDAELTITTHTTGEYGADRIIAFLCASYAYQNLRKKRKGQDIYIYEMYMQDALRDIYYSGAEGVSRVAYDPNRNVFYPRREKRGLAQFTPVVAEYT